MTPQEISDNHKRLLELVANKQIISAVLAEQGEDSPATFSAEISFPPAPNTYARRTVKYDFSAGQLGSMIREISDEGRPLIRHFNNLNLCTDHYASLL